jgi:hypothetical protein
MQEVLALAALYDSSILLDVETFHSLHILSLTVSLLSPSNITSIFALKRLRELTLTGKLSIGGGPCMSGAQSFPSALGTLSELNSFAVRVTTTDEGIPRTVWEFLSPLRQNLSIQRLAKLHLDYPSTEALSMLLLGGSPYNLETLVLSGVDVEEIFSLPVSNFPHLARLELNDLGGASESLPSRIRPGYFTFPQLEKLTSPAFVLFAFDDCPKLTCLDIITDESDEMVTLHNFPIPTFSKVRTLTLPNRIYYYVDMNVTFPAVWWDCTCTVDWDAPVWCHDDFDWGDVSSNSDHEFTGIASIDYS